MTQPQDNQRLNVRSRPDPDNSQFMIGEFYPDPNGPIREAGPEDLQPSDEDKRRAAESVAKRIDAIVLARARAFLEMQRFIKTFHAEVDEERRRQITKWGAQHHSPERWIAILGEEFGEAAKAVVERDIPHARKELIQVAAVVAAMLEDLADAKLL